MKKNLILFVANPDRALPRRPLVGKIAFLLWRLRTLSRRYFGPTLSLARAGSHAAAVQSQRKHAAITFHPRSHPGLAVIAIRGFARSYQSHPVKIRMGNRK